MSEALLTLYECTAGGENCSRCGRLRGAGVEVKVKWKLKSVME
jgi:hypothetical protein